MTLRTLLLLILVLFLFNNNYAQDKAVVSFSDFEHIKDSTEYNKKMIAAYKVFNKNNDAIPLDNLNKIIKFGEELDSSIGLSRAYYIKGQIFSNKLKYYKALQAYKKSLASFEKINDQGSIAQTYNQMFVVCDAKGELEKGANYLLKAKIIFEKIKDSSSLYYIYGNLGNVHKELKKYKLAEEEYLKAILIKRKHGSHLPFGTTMSNLAELYLYQKKFDMAEDMAQKALLSNKKDSLDLYIADSYLIFGSLYENKEEYQKAKKYYDSAMSLYSQEGDDLYYLRAKQNVGSIEVKLKNYKKAKRILRICRDEFSRISANSFLLTNYQISSKLDSVQGNLANALKWQHEYQKLSDQISSDLSTQKIEEAQAWYKEELAQLRTIDEQEIREQRNKQELFRYRVFTIIILGVIIISLLLVFWIVRKRKERKELITELNDSNQVKHKLFSIISHDLKNEIHGLEGSLNLMQDNEMSTEEFEEIVPLLADRTHQTSILLNNLLNWSKSQMKELRANPVTFDVSEVILDKFIFFKPKANQKNIKLINKLDSTNVYADRDMVAIVVQNLIANAIKFCKSGDSITLMSNDKDDYYEIGFQDTGVGIEQTNLSKLFSEETFTTHGTQNESGTGLGLKICKELIELNKGSIRVESILGEGSIFYVSLPKTVRE